MLRYSLSENQLTERPDDYTAHAFPTRGYTRDDIIEMMLQRGTLVTKTDIVAVLNNFEEVITGIIRDGSSINLPLFNASHSISGVFDSPTDSFDAGRHKVNVNLMKGTLLRNAERDVHLEKVAPTVPAPNIIEAKDYGSDTTNERLTPGGVLQVWGANLKIDGDDPAVGFWFVPETGDAVKAGILVSNKPASIIAVIPATLAPGNYMLRVGTQYVGGSILLKRPKMTTYDRPLAVS